MLKAEEENSVKQAQVYICLSCLPAFLIGTKCVGHYISYVRIKFIGNFLNLSTICKAKVRFF